MNTDKIKILAFDIDDTLMTTQKTIPQANIDALARAYAKGYELVICTGRGLTCVTPDVLALPGFRYAVSSNGARITDLKTKKTVVSYLIGEEALQPVLPYLSQPEIMLEVFIDNIVYADDFGMADLERYGVCTQASRNYMKNTRIPIHNCLQKIKDNYGKIENISIFMNNDPLRFRWLEEMQAFPGLNVVTSLPWNIEIGSDKASKGQGLVALAASMGLGPECLMCFGDSNNDLSMIEVAGIGVAMGNASDDLKAAADYITISNNDAGVAYALEQLLGI